MSVPGTLSAKVADARSSIGKLFVGDTSTSKTTKDVLCAEYKAIWGDAAQDEAEYRKPVQQKEQAALCLSGGGILRSGKYRNRARHRNQKQTISEFGE